jgi:hypothetical protein
MGRKHHILIALAVCVLGLIPAAARSDVVWELYTDTGRNAGPLLRMTVAPGQPFVISADDCAHVPAQSAELVNALDGVRFTLPQSPVSGTLTIGIILNVNGNAFDDVRGAHTFLNLSFEATVNGQERDDLTLSTSAPLEITIPAGDGFSFLLSSCGLSRNDDLIYAFHTGSGFVLDGVVTSNMTSGLKVTLTSLSPLVGGSGPGFGIPSSIKVGTWSAIKLLFR